MLKVTIEQKERSSILKLEGRLAGQWVEEVEQAWQAEAGANKDRYIEVDLSGISFIDSQGKQLLARMYEGGVLLVAVSPTIRHIVEEITRNQSGPEQKR